MSSLASQSCSFGPFWLDPENRLLLRDGAPVALTSKAFDALLFLVEHSGRLISRDELIRVLWPETFVDESNLTQTVSMLRKAIGETASDQRYIITVPGRGYRFAAEVKQVSGNGAAAERMRSSVPEAAAQTAARGTRWRWLAALAMALCLAVGTGYLLWARSWLHPRPGARVMLAVLPFANLTGDATEEYVSDGFTEEMITDLGHLDPQHLGVIARTSVMHYKNNRTSLAQITRDLGVQYVLEGSIRRDAQRVRVTAQLIQTKDQTHVWAQEYDRELKGLLDVQTEIAQEIGD